MRISRTDVGSGCDTARRKFWEECVTRSIAWLRQDAIKVADEMLAEWDKRWIVDATDDNDDNDIQANEVLP